jgi:hypothetical protein
MTYTVKNVKSFRGREGYGFNASLYRDGKRVALVMDAADGGCMSFEFEKTGADEETILLCYLKGRTALFAGEAMLLTPDLFIAGLVDDYEIDARLRKTCRYATAFRFTGKEDWHVVRIPFSSSLKAALLSKYPEIEEFANERPGVVS